MKKFLLAALIAATGLIVAEVHAQVRAPVDMRKIEIDLAGTNAVSERVELRGVARRVRAVTSAGATSTVSFVSDDGYTVAGLTNVTDTAVVNNAVDTEFVGLAITAQNSSDTTNTVTIYITFD